jgi:Lon protease-like protein
VHQEYVTSDRLYRVARVAYFDDDPVDAGDVAQLATTVGRTFKDVAAGMRALSGEVAEPGQLPTRPTELSLHVAAALDLSPQRKQELLILQSTADRLRRLLEYLHQVQVELTQQVERGLFQRRNGRRSARSPTSTDS